MKKNTLLFLGVNFCAVLNAQYVNRSIVYPAGVQRRVSIYLPSGYNPSIKYPLIVSMHGVDEGTSTYQPSMGYLQAYAAQMSSAMLASSAGSACIIACVESDSINLGSGNYESAFQPPTNYMAPVYARDSLLKWYSIDTSRIYLNGFSNGAWMALYSGLQTYKSWKAIFLWTPAVYSVNWAQNGFPLMEFNYANAGKIPICMTAGSADPYSLVDSVINIELLRANGNVNFAIVPGMGHAVPPNAYMFPCMDVINPAPLLDAGVSQIISPTTTGINSWSCNTAVSPEVTIINRGTTVLDTITVNGQIDNGAVSANLWTGNLAPKRSVNISLKSITTGGNTTHTLTVYTSGPNKGTDGNHLNDTLRETLNVEGSQGGLPFPLFEGFENPNSYQFQPGFDNVIGISWDLNSLSTTGTAGSNSATCIGVENYTAPQPGMVAEMTSVAPVDLSLSQNPWIKFDRAATDGPNRYFSGFATDSLYVLISTDCGNSFTVLKSYYGNKLATVPGSSNSTEFSPSSQNQWATDSINLGAYKSGSGVFIKFRSVCWQVNDVYIDNITIYEGVAVQSVQDFTETESIALYPNPFSDFTNIEFSTPGIHYVELDDIAGRKVEFLQSQQPQFILYGNAIAPGLYIVKIYDERMNYIASKKISIQ